ncbi:MAG: hypothetical protein IPM18_13175 [Phycisphaerales bacterium]|nr:hypothetical protein [Phycisphaerales bacterium]
MDVHRRILILTVSAGNGHVVAARGMEQALRAAAPQAEIAVIDAMEVVNPFFRRFYAGGYLWLVQHWPALMNWMYEAADRPPGGAFDRFRVLMQNANTGRMARFIRGWCPDLIVNTHYLTAEVAARLRATGRLHCPQVIIATDYETHRVWAQEPADRYFTATDLGRTLLAQWGVPREKISVTGVPLRAQFQQLPTRAAARDRCEIAPGVPLVLLLASGYTRRRAGEAWDELLALPPTVELVALAGRNAHLARDLESAAVRRGRVARVVGYTDRVHEWMCAADLAISKPGGLTMAEAMACGLPLLVLYPYPGQEQRNSDYLLEAGAGVRVNHVRLLTERVAGLLEDPAALARLRAGAAGLARPCAARTIAAACLELLSRGPV